MGFGLFIFYAWLPIFYALLGFEIGAIIGQWLVGGWGWIALLLGLAMAAAGLVSAYVLEPYRRAILGFAGGALLALVLESLLGLDRVIHGIFGIAFAVAGGVIGSILAPRWFDRFVIAATAFGGATFVVAGARLLLLGTSEPAGSFLPATLVIILTAIGIGWQLNNIGKWVPAEPMQRGPLTDPFAPKPH